MKSSLALTLVACTLAISACARSSRKSAPELASLRFVSAPSRIAWVAPTSSPSASGDAGLSGEIRFGGPLGRSALYLKFPDEWRARGIPQQAFLTLSAREGSASGDAPITLEAWRIDADWQPQTLRRWSDKPSLAPPYARARITATPVHDLRIDVSEIVRFAAQNPERAFGIAVIAAGTEGPGATFSSGLAGGRAPQLEVYLR